MRPAPLLLLFLPACVDRTADAGTPLEVPPPAATAPTRDAPPPDPPGPATPLTLREAAAAAGLGWPPPQVSIHIDKSDRVLEVHSGEAVLGRWATGLGGPLEDKVRMGDLATPEGTFNVVTRNDRSKFHLFLGINYPLAEDADRGLAAGLITAAEARAIREADRAGRVPPWETSLGGKIGIHGGGGSSDWTLGCIAVDNDVIEQIWEIAPRGTPVHIRR